jgi:putative copper export protein
VSVFPLLVIVHALAATVWTGGHLVLDLGVLPRALRERSAAQIRAFEETFEPLGLTALAVHARLRLIPNLKDDNLSGLAWHIRGITALAIAFVAVGALIRLGGLG